MIVPSPSADPVASSEIGAFSSPLYGPPASAVGGTLVGVGVGVNVEVDVGVLLGVRVGVNVAVCVAV